MKIQKLVTYLALLLGVLGMFFQGMIIFKGNDAIKSAAMGGDYGTVSLMVGLAFIILIVVVAVTVIFSLITLGSNPAKLKRAIISIASFGLIILIGYLFSSGDITPLKDGEMLSASGSRWVETGLRTFYFLAIIAIGLMFYSGVKKFIKK